MAPKKERTKLEVDALPRDFDPKEYLARVDPTEVDGRFFGRTIGRRGDYIFVETDEGLYQFEADYIKSIRPLHKELDMLTISREATFVMHGTISTAIRLSASREYRRVSDAAIDEMVERRAPLREIVDTLGGLGSREWRG